MAKKAASALDDRIAKMKTRIEKLELAKQIRDLRQKQKALK